MIYQPRKGQRVTLRYRKEARSVCRHLASGVIEIVGSGKIKNCLILLSDIKTKIVVPRGNLFREEMK